MLEEMSVVEGRKPARIVFNSRTGTVVIGKNVKVGEAAVSHGNLTVRISESEKSANRMRLLMVRQKS